MQLEYKLKFEAKDSNEGLRKITALAQTVKFLPVEDLEFIAKTSKDKPNWVKKAKPYTNYL